jgi:small subunit ribosomal protein S6
MKRYETIVIIDPDLSKEAEAPILERVTDLIPQFNGFLIETDDWGTKKLAYDIKKKNRGHYVRLDFCGDGTLVQEMERFFRIDDKVMKFMTVLLDNDADLEAIKAQLAEKAESDAQAAQATAAATDTVEEKADAPEAAPAEPVEPPVAAETPPATEDATEAKKEE